MSRYGDGTYRVGTYAVYIDDYDCVRKVTLAKGHEYVVLSEDCGRWVKADHIGVEEFALGMLSGKIRVVDSSNTFDVYEYYAYAGDDPEDVWHGTLGDKRGKGYTIFSDVALKFLDGRDSHCSAQQIADELGQTVRMIGREYSIPIVDYCSFASDMLGIPTPVIECDEDGWVDVEQFMSDCSSGDIMDADCMREYVSRNPWLFSMRYGFDEEIDPLERDEEYDEEYEEEYE